MDDAHDFDAAIGRMMEVGNAAGVGGRPPPPAYEHMTFDEDDEAESMFRRLNEAFVRDYPLVAAVDTIRPRPLCPICPVHDVDGGGGGGGASKKLIDEILGLASRLAATRAPAVIWDMIARRQNDEVHGRGEYMAQQGHDAGGGAAWSLMQVRRHFEHIRTEPALMLFREADTMAVALGEMRRQMTRRVVGGDGAAEVDHNVMRSYTGMAKVQLAYIKELRAALAEQQTRTSGGDAGNGGGGGAVTFDAFQ